MQNAKCKIKNGVTVPRQALSLLEMIFVIALLSLVVVTIAPYFRTTVESWKAGDRQFEVVQNARVGMDEMIRTLKTATAFATYENGSDAIEFTDAAGSTVQFDVRGGGILQKQTTAHNWVDVAQPVDNLEFTYYDAEGNEPADETAVRSVRIALTVSDIDSAVDPIIFSAVVTPRKNIIPVTYDLAINEINYDPPGSICSGGSRVNLSEAANEWVELYNFGSEAIDLNGWTITDTTASDTLSGWAGGATSLPAGGYAIIVATGSTAFTYYDDCTWDCGDSNWEDACSNDCPTGVICLQGDDSSLGNKLGNSSDTITISDGDGNEADSVTYGDWGGIDGDTIERIDHSTSPSEGTNWEASSDTGTYTAGAANTT